MNRRNFLASGAAAALTAADERPNILWITCEDTGPQLGCYGDPFANTPNLDALAARSLKFLNAWSNFPVCAPARTTIISGLYPSSTGSEHMRSMTRLPENMKMFPCYLREAGYYCTNNVKEDYNLEHTGKVWDESSAKAHYRNRKQGQPFFAVFNNTITHESQIRRRPHTLVHDPSKVRVRDYHPDTPEVRHDWAQYYDNITTMDTWAGKLLGELEEAGLADSTIVFFYGDHGSGMPRSKRWPYNSGLHVPMIVHMPEKFRQLAPKGYKAGGESDRLVSFVDLAPTILSLAGIQPQPWHQGHAFAGKFMAPEQPYIYGFRGRMDERYDLTRSVRDKRYVYLRQYMPNRAYGQHVAYMFETPTTQLWKKLNDEGKLKPEQRIFWNEKPAEELYDLQADRDEVRNLASSPSHQAVLKRMRKAQQNLARKIKDVGFLPEGEIHERSKGSTPCEMGHDAGKYPFDRVFAAAEAASMGKPVSFDDPDPAVRFWVAQSYLVRKTVNDPLRKALDDSSPYVRVVAAEALGRYGAPADVEKSLKLLAGMADARKHGVFVSVLALNALDFLSGKARGVLSEVEKLPRDGTPAHARFGGYVPRLVEKILRDLKS